MSGGQAAKTTIFYDGGCKVCAWEIESYRARDSRGRLELVDVDASGFDASAYGLDPERVNRVLHVRGPDGKWVTGVDAFAEIWRALDRPFFGFLARLSRGPLRPAMLLGYEAFTRVRPWLPRNARCEGDRCSVQTRSA